MSSNYTTVHVAWVINVSSIPLHFQDAQGALCRGGMAGLRDANTGAAAILTRFLGLSVFSCREDWKTVSFCLTVELVQTVALLWEKLRGLTFLVPGLYWELWSAGPGHRAVGQTQHQLKWRSGVALVVQDFADFATFQATNSWHLVLQRF